MQRIVRLSSSIASPVASSASANVSANVASSVAANASHVSHVANVASDVVAEKYIRPSFPAGTPIPGTRVYFKNLPATVDSASLRSVVRNFGKTNFCKVALEPVSGRSKLRGTVIFEDERCAEACIQRMHLSEFWGSPALLVTPASQFSISQLLAGQTNQPGSVSVSAETPELKKAAQE